MAVHIPIAKLSDLALMRFVLHLKDLCDLNHPTKLIEDYIEERIPPYVANEYTKALLTVMIKIKLRGKYRTKYETMEAAEMIVHSATTKLKSQYQNYSFSINMLRKLKNLQIISISDADPFRPSQNIIGRFSQLREFTYVHCTDEIVRELATNCLNLQKLVTGIHWRSSGLSDESVNYIIKFTKLKHLIIKNTTFSKQGTSDLLSGLSNRKIITFLGIPLKTEDHYRELPETITHLELVKNHYYEFKLPSLSRLKNLKSLTLTLFEYDEFNHLLLEVGSQLQKLGLNTINDLDLNFVVGACPFLKVLELYKLRYQLKVNFKTVTSCIFHNPYLEAVQGILNKCPHVQNVVLCEYDRIYPNKLLEFIKMKQIGQNEMYIGCKDENDKFTAKMKVIVGNEIVVQSVDSSRLSDYFKDFVIVFRECTSRDGGY